MAPILIERAEDSTDDVLLPLTQLPLLARVVSAERETVEELDGVVSVLVSGDSHTIGSVPGSEFNWGRS